jgi:glutamate racemase
VLRVGMFDSGVGGLSVWREIVRQHPGLDTLYVADQAHIPYGPRPVAEILAFARGISRFLVENGCNTIVLACNAASAAALGTLRTERPDITFVGMEPAVKPAVASSRRRIVGVLSTPATLRGDLFASSVQRFAAGVHLIPEACPGLVERIEEGDVDSPETRALLQHFLQPSLAAGADTIVLACTHYPFVQDTIRALVGANVAVIDPAPAVAQQVGRVTGAPHARRQGTHTWFTTGDVARFAAVAGRLLGRSIDAAAAHWDGDQLRAATTRRAETRPA